MHRLCHLAAKKLMKKQNCCHHGMFPGMKTVKIAFVAGAPPGPAVGTYSTPPDPIAGFKGEGKEKGKGKGQRDREEGKGGKDFRGREEGRKGKGKKQGGWGGKGLG